MGYDSVTDITGISSSL